MPRKPAVDFAALGRQLARLLHSQQPASAVAIATNLGVSRATVARLLARQADAVLAVGQGRARRYAGRRTIDGVGSMLPVFEIDEAGRALQIARLHAVRPTGFYVESTTGSVRSGFHVDLPYFLAELRPSGFLGRLLPRRHPDLDLPPDIQRWSTDDCLKYLTRYGWNLPGNLLVGERALEGHLASLGDVRDTVTRAERGSAYARRAEDVLGGVAVGSSAGGEQPKFLASLMPGAQAVLVKFSPRLGNPVAQRWADLLVAEHLAHDVMRSHGQAACRSELVESADRLFLEIERFDRLGGGGRRGVIAIAAVDAEFVGGMQRWSATAAALVDAGQIRVEVGQSICWREQFGQLIANSDMHFWNLAFFATGESLLGLAPSYDMLPMLYAPVHGNLRTTAFTPTTPSLALAAVWRTAHLAARELWSQVASQPLVSAEFRTLARDNVDAVDRWAELADKLPAAR